MPSRRNRHTLTVTRDNLDREALLRMLLDQLPALVWTTDGDLRVTAALGELADSPSLTAVGTTLVEQWGAADEVGAIAAHRRALAGESVEHEHEVGGRILASHLEPLRDASGAVAGVIGVAVDVTATRTLEHSQRERERQLEALFDQVPATIWTTDDELVITAAAGAAASPRLRDFVGRTVQQFLEAGEEELPPLAAHRRSLAGERAEYEHHFRGGIFATHLRPLRDVDGRVTGVIGVDVDITEIRRVERELQMVEARYASLVEELPLVSYQTSSTGEMEVLAVSPQIETLLGYPPERWVGQPAFVRESIHPDDRERVLEELRRSRAQGDRFQLEYRLLRADGDVVWVLDETVVVRDEQGRELANQGFLLDVTHRKHLEEQLRQSQKMEAIGRLAGGIAHDFNNLLTAIKGYGAFLLADLDEDSSSHHDAEEILLAADSAAALTRQLLAFSRREPLTPEVLSLNEVVKNLDGLLGRLLGDEVELIVELDSELPDVHADRGQLEQVVLNLAVNARDALSAGGRLTIATARRMGSPPQALLRVSDTGIGMGPEVRSRLFEPFFTTKEAGKGTGLGLATVYGIVGQSGGTIEVESAPGEGATFTIALPAVVGEPVGDTQPAAERILLVDDDELVRDVMSEVLERAGYVVSKAAGPAQAIELIQLGHPFALLVTDLRLPGMSGIVLADRLLTARPDLQVLVTSGQVDEELRAARHVLEKPFTPDELLRAVGALLGH